MRTTFRLRIIFVFLFTLTFSRLHAQFITSSPYSGYGLGEVYYPGLAFNTGFGFAGSALDSNQHVNVLNPAALSSLNLSTFEGSVVSRSVFYNDGLKSSFKNNTALDHVVFGMPLKKKAGISFGLMPYSGLGVFNSDTVNVAGYGDINYLSEDSGGINKGFVAFGFAVKKFSFGVEGGYLFGNINRQRDLVILNDPNALNVSRLVGTRTTGVVAKAGVHYKTLIGKIRLGLAATYSPAISVKSYSTLVTQTFETNAAGGRTNVKTVESTNDIAGSINIPSSIGAGVAISKGKFTFAGDFLMTKWSEFKAFEPRDTVIENGEALFSGADSLGDSWRVGGGVQFVPDSASPKILLRGRYRMGAYYVNSGLKINGVKVPEYGLTLGWGIPMRRVYRDRIPFIEAAVAFGERGSIENGLVRERFISARVGVTISDRWFIRRKFD